MYERSEKNSKSVLNLGNTGSGQTVVRSLCDSKGSITVNPQTIMNEVRYYNQSLYSIVVRIPFEARSYVQTLLLTAKKNSRTEREGKLSCAECCDTLLKFQNSKAPGNDGLTGEFFQGFWNLLSQQLTDSLNFSFEHG